MREAAERRTSEADSRQDANFERAGAGAGAEPPPRGAVRLNVANVTGAWAHLGWLCGRHMVATQEHGLSQQPA
eukprot:8815452-Alexandrium_andersonii.AAC.1